MRFKIGLTLTFLLISFFVFSQSPKINTELPQIGLPSPTVSALMKFEEIPVNNYTGIPDISIPLYSIQSLSKDIALNLSLKYHPASASGSDVASEVGLGWSLFAGGSISRTVRGYPDELYQQGDGNGFAPSRIGVYHSSNNYSNILKLFPYGIQNVVLNEQQRKMISEFLWESYEKGKYDTEHDLYQYNFMGYTGRFYIINQDGEYIVVKLDNDNNVKIIYYHNTQTFVLYDDNGNKFYFDIKEVTTKNPWTESYHFDSTISMSPIYNYNYVSAFHLSKITTDNNKTLIEFNYNDNSEVFREASKGISTNVDNYITDAAESDIINHVNNLTCGQVNRIEPKKIIDLSTFSTNTKKVKQIIITGKAKIDLIRLSDRSDTYNENSSRLVAVNIKKLNNDIVKKFNFTHIYSVTDAQSTSEKQRMLLSKISETDIAGNSLSHSLYYKTPKFVSGLETRTIDYWGYFTAVPKGSLSKEAHPEYTTDDMLQKIVLPTGGSIVFDLESNTYSHIGNEPVQSFKENIYNWTNQSISGDYTLNDNNSKLFYFSINEDQEVKFVINAPLNVDAQNWGYYSLSVHKYTGSSVFQNKVNQNDPGIGNSVSKISLTSDNQSCSTNLFQNGNYHSSMLLPKGDYVIKFVNNPNCMYRNNNPVKYNYVCNYKTYNNSYKYLYGGGVRIARIRYFGTNVDIENVEGIDAAKAIKYNYDFFTTSLGNSGSLVFAKPVYEYSYKKTHYFYCVHGDSGFPQSSEIDINYKKITAYNNLFASKTHGADVGYQNVTVSESGNGKSEYTYTSPIDQPDEKYYITYPFVPPKNIDYKRGLLTSEKKYTEFGKLLHENKFSYDFVNKEKTTGFKVYSPDGCKYIIHYSLHESYYTKVQTCTENCKHCGFPVDYIKWLPVIESFGWVTLKSKITKDYYYDRNNKENIVETKEEYTFNPVNKKPSDYIKYTHKVGNVTERHREFYTYNINNSLNKLSDIETVTTFANGEQVSKQKINYNSNHYPQSISAGKGNNALEDKILFNKYDDYGNPVEMQRADGIKITYIRDANTTDPLAVIENASYTQIIALLGNPPGGFTQENIANLNGLRASLPNARVTTYTYKPLVGISSVTDPRGISTTYEYDGFGRLKVVRDNKGKLISENEYKYRTQN